MNCEQAKTLVHALADGELDAGHAREVESHVASCADCAGEFAHIRDLRKDMASVNLRFAAPERLRRNIERGLPAPALQASRRDLLKGFGFGAGLSAIAASGLFLVVFRNDAQHRLGSRAISTRSSPGSPAASTSRRRCLI